MSDNPSNKPLHILHLTAGSDAGGLSRYIHDLAIAMTAQGHRVTIAGEKGAWHWLFEQSKLRWIDVPLKGGPLALFRAARHLKSFLKDNPADVLHTHYRRPTLVARRLQSPAHQPPILYTLHLSHLSLSPLMRPFSDFGDYSHVASEEARDWLRDDARVPASRITLLPHGIDTSRFPIARPQDRAFARKQLNLQETDTVAAYVGRLDVPKNEEWLLDLAAAWPPSTSHSTVSTQSSSSTSRLYHSEGTAQSAAPSATNRLVILLAGQGPHEAMLRQRIAAQGLQHKVRLLGHRDPLPIYQAADLLLLPSAREGFSLVTAESMSVGTPVLRTQTSGTQGLIIEGNPDTETGLSTPINHSAFVSAALTLLSNPARLAAMRPRAAAHIRNHFTFQKQLDGTMAMYRNILSSKPKA